VDRGRFFPPSERALAYNDAAWKSDTGSPGRLHLSAPCIYANALEHLDLQAGQAFLNVGSGTGYLNTMAGFLLGACPLGLAMGL
jgi:protein-L-isoaspartate O-methyltransferase